MTIKWKSKYIKFDHYKTSNIYYMLLFICKDFFFVCPPIKDLFGGKIIPTNRIPKKKKSCLFLVCRLCSADRSKRMLFTTLLYPVRDLNWQCVHSLQNKHTYQTSGSNACHMIIGGNKEAAIVVSAFVTHHGLPSVCSHSLSLTHAQCGVCVSGNL